MGCTVSHGSSGIISPEPVDVLGERNSYTRSLSDAKNEQDVRSPSRRRGSVDSVLSDSSLTEGEKIFQGGRRASWGDTNANIVFDAGSSTVPYVGGIVSVILYKAVTPDTAVRKKKVYIKGEVVANSPLEKTFIVRTKQGVKYDVELARCRWRWSDDDDEEESGKEYTMSKSARENKDKGGTDRPEEDGPRRPSALKALIKRHSIKVSSINSLASSSSSPHTIRGKMLSKTASQPSLVKKGSILTHVFPRKRQNSSHFPLMKRWSTKSFRNIDLEASDKLALKDGFTYGDDELMDSEDDDEGEDEEVDEMALTPEMTSARSAMPRSRKSSITIVHTSVDGEMDVEAWKKKVEAMTSGHA